MYVYEKYVKKRTILAANNKEKYLQHVVFDLTTKLKLCLQASYF